MIDDTDQVEEEILDESTEVEETIETELEASTDQTTESEPNPLADNPAFEEIPLEERLVDDGISQLFELILLQRAL